MTSKSLKAKSKEDTCVSQFFFIKYFPDTYINNGVYKGFFKIFRVIKSTFNSPMLFRRKIFYIVLKIIFVPV